MHSGGRPVEDAEGDMRRAVRLHSCQTVTPETDDDARTTSSSSRAASSEGDHSIAEALYRRCWSRSRKTGR